MTRGRLILSLTSTLLSLAVAEVALRTALDGPSLIRDPALRFVLHPDPRFVPGVSGPALVEAGPEGLRGDPAPDGGAYRVVTLGGSTTECVVLDAAETWPALLETGLRSALDRPVWVGNGGMSGVRSRHHVLQMQALLEQLPDLDAVVALVGANDLLWALQHQPREGDWYENPRERVRVHYEAFDVPRRPRFGPRYERTGLVHALRRARQGWARLRASAGLREAADGHEYVRARQLRAAAPSLDELPDLGAALSEYRHNLERLVALGERHGVPLVFATQPAMWRAELPAGLESLLWSGEKDPARPPPGPGFYSPAALARGLETFNARLLDVCRARGLTCLDLASLLPPDTTVFYDDMHFNESGARKVAAAMVPFLAARASINSR
jgi:lysophospholipase L1-like esterase